MATSNLFKSDLFRLYDIIQASMIVYPKEVIIATLRDFFAKDSYYHYSKDAFGFPNVTDHTNLPLGADMPFGAGSHPELNPSATLPTRLFIGENYHYDTIFYPAILVKNGGTQYVPISINRNKDTISYQETLFVDGYGNETLVRKPYAFVTAGAWEGSISIDILTRSLRARDDLVELVSMFFTEIAFDDLYEVGLIIKPISVSAPSETDDRNDKLFRQTLTLNIRSEWRREIKIYDFIDTILFTAFFADLNSVNPINAPNLTIETDVLLEDVMPE